MRKIWKIIIYISSACVIVAAGAVTGFVVKRKTAEPIIDYVDFDISNFKPDYDGIMKRYNEYNGTSYESKFSPAEMVAIAQYKFDNAENNYYITHGTGVTALTQEIRNFHIKNGSKYFEESISKSNGSLMGISVALASRYYQEGELLKEYDAEKKDITLEYAKYDENVSSSYTLDEYRAKMGRSLEVGTNYVVSDSLVLESNVKKDSENYEVFLKVNPEIAVFNYVKQMKSISGLDSYPVFEFCELTYKLSKTMDLIELNIHEKYNASMSNVATTMDQKMRTTYFPNAFVEIPEVNGGLSYSQDK